MKKITPYIVAVILFGAALALQICYDRANPSLPPTHYDGAYVDLMAQAEYETWRRSSVPSGSIYILKVDQETGLPVCMTMKQDGRTEVDTSFFHNSIQYDLRFINDVLTGVRESHPKKEPASWETDPALLKPILDDYAAQVQALFHAAHPVGAS